MRYWGNRRPGLLISPRGAMISRGWRVIDSRPESQIALDRPPFALGGAHESQRQSMVGVCLVSLVSAPSAQIANDAINKSLDLFRKMAQPQQKPATPGSAKGSSQPPAEASQASESSEQAQPRSAVDPDVLGLRLGMTAEEADVALAKRFPSAKRNALKVEVQGPPKTSFVAAVGVIQGAVVDGEYVGIYLAAPPNQRSVLGIYRQLLYSAAKAPNRAELLQALESKYGRPTSRADTSAGTIYRWHYDRAAVGKCAAGPRPGLVMDTLTRMNIPDFENQMAGYGATYWSTLVRFSQPIEACGRVLEASVATDQSKQLVRGITVFFSDSAAVAKAYGATRAWSASAQSAAQQERVNASKGKTPSL